ncbi:helix-hairpin-helix domain-containing protein [Ancylothrix sp. C2]|uniref:helix-hairpin-helix domain-containing protein n=1 Tax=Ancylothrix sp. D3o TaxID=2953691 RepID=UPI0021BBB19E|nr:helix-hairpin-helix domain-containing protein [Ancylothrix sp. D3o]MCT7949486.1 helix-hairpin-helix domain-containing protein [Ancylothrix sp. D3o]
MVFSFRLKSLIFASAALMLMAGCNTNSANNNTATNPNSNATPTATSNTASNEHGGSHNNGKKININSAILSELDKLEAKLGVPALSNKIQGSRPYANTEELVSKKVITQEQFDQIKDMVTVEDITLTGEAKDIDYMTKLGLMKGHLIVAKELLDQQKPDQAEPHIGHPVEEIYIDVEEQLQERNVKEFKSSLINLQNLVKANGKSEKIKPEFEASMQAIDSAIQGLPEQQRNDPKFVLQVINELLDAANSEYGSAIASGKISAAIEYQDSRGFVIYANSLYKTISQQMEKQHPQAHKAIEKSMADLTKAWPKAIPPAAPVMTPEQVSKLVKTIEDNSQKVIKS